MRIVRTPPNFCNRAYFVRSGRTCALKLFCSKQVFPHGGNTVPRRCFTVENETKETDNDDKTAETATTDARIDERMRQLSFGLKEFKIFVISHDLTEKNRADAEKLSFLVRMSTTCVCVQLQMEYTLKGYALDCTHTLA